MRDDPFRFIPSAKAIRQRLVEAQEFVRRLLVLLRTAEEIEQGGDRPQGGDHE